ncbi:hypothetical protein [Niveibacterium sp.]|uniref:hypothetical protein n=1 Tax=Niveibacterium sp. TaxID=2017444 RepID=UPI0035AD918C
MAVENAKLSPLRGVTGKLVASDNLLAIVRNHADSALGEKYLSDDLVTNGASHSPGVGHHLTPALSSEAFGSAHRTALFEPATPRDGAYCFPFRRSSINPSINFKKHLS